MNTNDPPRLIATIGLHGSASTWVFNVVRELLIAVAGEDAVRTLYADEVGQLPPPEEWAGGCLLIKSHHGSLPLDRWLEAEQARILLSVRDPRDAAISMCQRFKAPLNATARWLGYDCARLGTLAAKGLPVVRYENRFFDDPNTVTEIAALFGLAVPAATRQAIFDRYRTDQVKAFADRLSELPDHRLTKVGAATMDKVTQILGPHIGDGRTGKWRGLPEPARTELTRFFGPFLDQFKYPR
jgi:hypothetical protein